MLLINDLHYAVLLFARNAVECVRKNAVQFVRAELNTGFRNPYECYTSSGKQRTPVSNPEATQADSHATDIT